MRVDIVTIFPEAFAPLDLSILGRARERGLLEIVVWDLREFTTDRHRQVDDSPSGGGAGMVMKPEPFLAAVDAIRAAAPATSPRIILTSPQGERLTLALARRLAGEAHLVILCGHYEGIDERVGEGLAAEEISIGDYVLTGGELPAMVIVDAVARFFLGVIGGGLVVVGDYLTEGVVVCRHWETESVC